MGLLWLASLLFVVNSGNEEKIESKLVEIDSPIQEVIYCGVKKDVILLISQERLVYRSENSGFSFKQVSSGTEKVEKVQKVISSKADPKLIAFISKLGRNWFSEDCGKTVRSLNNANRLEDFQFHPTHRAWGIAGSWKKCEDPEDIDCRQYRVLYLTKDLGTTWEPILDYVVQFGWGTAGFNPELTKTIPTDRIYATRSTNPEANQRTAGWSYDMEFVKSDDFFATTTTLLPHGNKFLLANKFLLVASAIQSDTEEVQLMIANEENLEEFHRAELPVKKMPEHSYTLLDTSEGSIFIHVNHYKDKASYGTIYISDSTGWRFSLSLARNVRGRSGYCDFEKVKGIEGIYLSNVYDKDHTGEDSSDKKGKKDTKKFQKSLITFDKGGEWRSLEPPTRDANGIRITCEDCNLHLHSVTSDYSSVYSNENAIGIILATGNVGKYLSYKEDELNTYLSRDGGLTWTEVKKGEYIYEMGDHGAIIVMADSQKATDKIFYSWNEGLTWESLKMDEAFEVENILIEPTATSQKFLVYGEKEGKGMTFSVDFSEFQEPMCKNPSSPGSPDSDYEVWSPTDGRSNGCLMGHKVEYVRKKQKSECFNGEEFERPKFVENCVCTESDFECDVGYYKEGTSTCVKSSTFTDTQTCENSDFVYITTGYRRVAGNTCVEGVSRELEPTKVSCDTSSTTITYLILILVVGAILVAVLKQYGHKVKGFSFTWAWATEQFDKKGFFSDFTKAPQGMDDDDEDITNKKDYKDDEEEFDPRS